MSTAACKALIVQQYKNSTARLQQDYSSLNNVFNKGLL